MRAFVEVRQLGHRLTVCWLTVLIASVGWLEPTSLSHVVVQRGGLAGHVAAALLVLAAAAGLVDALAEMAGRRSRWLAVNRHQGYLLVAALHVAFVLTMAMSGSLNWLALQYGALAMGAVWIAVLDVALHREARA